MKPFSHLASMERVRRRLLAASGTLVLLTGCAPVPSAPPTVAARTQASEQVIAARQAFRSDYRSALQTAFPNLNDIDVSSDGINNAEPMQIEAYHPFLGRYTFAAGPQKHALQIWTAARAEQLKQARIGSVSACADATNLLDKTYFYDGGEPR